MKEVVKFKSMAMCFFIAMLSLSFASCSDDDDEDPISGISDYYITCSVSGGGLTPQELNAMESQLNAELSQYEWRAVDADYALYEFNNLVRELQRSFSGGVSGISGTLRMNLQLKSADGQTISSATLNITNDDCTLS